MAFWNRRDRPEVAEERALYLEDVWGDSRGIDTITGAHIGSNRALQMVAVWSCVSLISDNVSTLPLELFHTKKGSAPLDEQAWMTAPNPEMTAVDFWHRVLTSLLLDGNAFVLYDLNSSGGFNSLTPIHPELVSVQRNRNSGKVEYWIGGVAFDSGRIIHIKAFTVAGSLRGLSPIEYARVAIGLGLTAEEFGARFYDQGITMSGVIETQKDLTPAQATILAKTFSQAHQGTRKSHLPGVITNGGSWKQLSISPEQAQFLETRRFQKQEIAALFRVPAYLLDPSVTSSWGTGIQEQNRAFVQYTLLPWIVRIEQAISAVINPRALKVKFNLDGLLRGSMSERYAAYEIGIRAGFLTVADVRAEEKLEPLPEPPPKPDPEPVDEGSNSSSDSPNPDEEGSLANA